MIPSELNPWLCQLDASKIDALQINLEDKKISFKLTPAASDHVDLNLTA